METKNNKGFPIFLTLCLALFLTSGLLWAAPAVPDKKEASKPAEAAKPAEPSKKGEKFVVKGREYCYECIDNSECLKCHEKKVTERKFAQSVHGANSCNSCHWDITDIKEHVKNKGAKIHSDPATCLRCHKKEAT